MKKYHTYIVNFYPDDGEFDYYIFHSKTEFDRNKIAKEFKRLRNIDYGYNIGKYDNIEDIIEYKTKNYPKVN